ncbi:MAG: PilZ domain-containing protein [Myxococcota bacterium]
MSLIGRLRDAAAGSSERRRTPRIRCRLRCTIVGRRRVPARVLDVSEGGLCLSSPVAPPLKHPLLLEIDVPVAGLCRVEAVVWHVRPVKRGASRRNAWSVGMMITKADDAFERLVCGTFQEMEEERPAEVEEGPDPEPLRPFRVRVKSCSGPRTRTLTLEAVSADEADALAQVDLGADWTVLEVKPA